jgi:SAM-dependent methyltransferase
MDREDWDRRYAGDELIWTAEPNRMLVTEVGTIVPGRALDLGCGEGRNAVWLARQGWSVTAVDFSDVGLDKGRRLADAHAVTVDWVLADLRTYAPEAGFYDLVVALYLHLDAQDRRRVHAAAAAALRPAGTMFVVGHDSSNLTHGYGGPRDPSILFSPEDVVGDLTGMSIVKAERVLRPVAGTEPERTAVDALVRAIRPPAPRSLDGG